MSCRRGIEEELPVKVDSPVSTTVIQELKEGRKERGELKEENERERVREKRAPAALPGLPVAGSLLTACCSRTRGPSSGEKKS